MLKNGKIGFMQKKKDCEATVTEGDWLSNLKLRFP